MCICGCIRRCSCQKAITTHSILNHGRNIVSYETCDNKKPCEDIPIYHYNFKIHNSMSNKYRLQSTAAETKLTPCEIMILNMNTTNSPNIPNHLYSINGVILSSNCWYCRWSLEYWAEMGEKGASVVGSEEDIMLQPRVTS